MPYKFKKLKIIPDSINRGHHNTDIERWQRLDFVLGYEIKRSNNSDKECEMCSKLTGKYPKSYMWTGWHDGCKCYITPIMLPKDAFIECQKKILKGEDYSEILEKYEITDFPVAYKEYFK